MLSKMFETEYATPSLAIRNSINHVCRKTLQTTNQVCPYKKCYGQSRIYKYRLEGQDFVIIWDEVRLHMESLTWAYDDMNLIMEAIVDQIPKEIDIWKNTIN